MSNNCTDGLREKYTAKAQMCPGKAPHGLHVATTDGRLVAEQGHNATFIILMEEVGAPLLAGPAGAGLRFSVTSPVRPGLALARRTLRRAAGSE